MRQQSTGHNEPFILYVDDDPDDLLLVDETLKAIDASLEMEGYTNGKDAFAFLESIPHGEALPNLVILDLNMPGWNGLQVLDAIKENSIYHDIPVFIFTNSDHPRHRELSMSKGAVDFVTKPYRNEELMRVCSVFAGYTNHPIRRK